MLPVPMIAIVMVVSSGATRLISADDKEIARFQMGYYPQKTQLLISIME